jgi:hypothetical protein
MMCLAAGPSRAADEVKDDKSAEGKPADEKNECTIAVKEDNDVFQACKQGGIKRAKVVMKAMQRIAKKGGLIHDCDDCHKDESTDNWTLTEDGAEKFKKMLTVIAEAKTKTPPATPPAK